MADGLEKENLEITSSSASVEQLTLDGADPYAKQKKYFQSDKGKEARKKRRPTIRPIDEDELIHDADDTGEAGSDS